MIADEIIRKFISSLDKNEINELFQVVKEVVFDEDITNNQAYTKYQNLRDKVFTDSSDINGNVDCSDVDRYIMNEIYKYLGRD